MLKKLAAGLIAAAVLAVPVLTGTAVSPAEAATAKTVSAKHAKTHRMHRPHVRLVHCYVSAAQARHVRLHAGKRFQRVACYLPNQAKAHVRKHVRHASAAVKHVKMVKTAKRTHAVHAKHIKIVKPGRAG